MGFTWMIPPADYQRPLDPPPRELPPPKLEGRLDDEEPDEPEELLELGGRSLGMTCWRTSSSPHTGQARWTSASPWL
jgi:hypothetical protein